jgi:hypothetical protein
MTPEQNEPIERFVRVTLGCKCPDEVFQKVAVEPGQLADGKVAFTRLTIGDRLLIYVFEATADRGSGRAAAQLTERGRKERDTRGLNRFRLVVATGHPTQLLERVQARFARAADGDERCHLHVLATDQLPAAVRPTHEPA